MTINAYKRILMERLTEKRYLHSLAVADEALRLAKKYGADPDKAYLAGLLHDIMKDTPKEEMLQTIERFGIILTDIEKNAPKLWHAMAGACYVRRQLDIEDEGIVRAIRYHTTARKNMSLLERILYLADFTSADRDYPGVEDMRIAVDKDMETALTEALTFTIVELAREGHPIHPDTFEAYNQIALEHAGEVTKKQ